MENPEHENVPRTPPRPIRNREGISPPCAPRRLNVRPAPEPDYDRDLDAINRVIDYVENDADYWARFRRPLPPLPYEIQWYINLYDDNR